MRSLALALCASFVLTGCGGGGSDSGSNNTDTGNVSSDNSWTIMVYGHADHNLTPNMIKDLQEMIEVSTSDKFKIVLQLDLNDQTIADMGLSNDIPAGVQRGIISNKDFEPQTNIGEQNLDDPSQLSDFITWTKVNHPADRYGLVMWNHGGQWKGFGGDTQNGTSAGNPMLVSSMAAAIREAMQSNNIPTFEFLAFDTCLMGGAEVLSDFTDITDILIANPEIDYGDGWDYDASLNWLASNPSSSAMAFAQQEAETWRAHHLSELSDSNDKAFAMHVVYDLTKYNTFEQQWLSFSQQLVLSGEQSSFANVRRGVTQYSIGDIREAGDPTDYIDLGEFAASVGSNSSNSDLQTSAQNLVSAIKDMTVSVVAGSRKQNASGLSVWYPLNGTKNDTEFAAYQQLTSSQTVGDGWDEYLTSIQAAYQSEAETPALSQLTIGNDSANSSIPFSFNVLITENDIASIESIVVDHVDPSNPGNYYILGQAEIFAPSSGANTYSVDWDTSLPTISDGTTTAFLGSFQESPDSPFLISYAHYSPPNSDEQQVVILFTEVVDDTLVVVGALDGEAEGDIAPRAVELTSGGGLTPLHLSFSASDPIDLNTWSDLTVISANDSTLIIPENGVSALTVGFNQLVNGTYLLLTQAEDNYGNESDVLANLVTVNE